MLKILLIDDIFAAIIVCDCVSAMRRDDFTTLQRATLIDKFQLIDIGVFVVPFILTVFVSSYLTYRILVAGIKIGRAVRDDPDRADGLNAAIESDSED